MERPTYMPLKAWNIMSDADKKEFFKNQKVQPVITIDSDSDSDDSTSQNIIKVDIKKENITQPSLNNRIEQKKILIFYKKKII